MNKILSLLLVFTSMIMSGQTSFTGNVIDAKEKAKYIGELCDQYKLKENQVIAIGDGANDIEMMKIAGLSVAYQAKPLLKQYCNIQINFGNLKSLIDFFDFTFFKCLGKAWLKKSESSNPFE